MGGPTRPEGGQKRLDRTVSVKKTAHVGKTLKKVAEEMGVSLASMDFDIIESTTYIKESETGEYTAFSQQHGGRIEDDTYLLNPHLKIQQTHEVRIRPVEEDKTMKLQTGIMADKLRTSAKLVIKKGSFIRPDGKAAQRLLHYLNKIKAKNGMLLHMRDKEMRLAVSEIIGNLGADGILAQDEEVLLASWPRPKPTVHDEIIYHFKDKDAQHASEVERVDYKDRGFVHTAATGELLIEYVKPGRGSPGRDFSGRFVPAEEPRTDNAPGFKPDPSTIEVRDDAKKRLYLARKEGYVKLDEAAGELKIDEQMELDGISMKSTGDIKAGVDKNVKISIGGKDASEDQVGPDMTVEASELRVKGSVANGATIKAGVVEVGGSTHKTSAIYGKQVKVHVHKGHIEGEEVHVKFLENGEIHGLDVTVESAMGGVIYGRKVEIQEIKAPVKVVASKLIVVHKDDKGGSKFYFDPTATRQEQKEIEEIREALKKMAEEKEACKAKVVDIGVYLKKNEKQMEEVKGKILTLKQSGTTPPSVLVNMLKGYIQKVKSYEVLKQQFQGFDEKIAEKQEALKTFQGGALQARLMKEGGIWNGDHELFYVILEPAEEIHYLIREKSIPGAITLVKGKEKYRVARDGEEPEEKEEETPAEPGEGEPEAAGEEEVEAQGDYCDVKSHMECTDGTKEKPDA